MRHFATTQQEDRKLDEYVYTYTYVPTRLEMPTGGSGPRYRHDRWERDADNNKEASEALLIECALDKSRLKELHSNIWHGYLTGFWTQDMVQRAKDERDGATIWDSETNMFMNLAAMMHQCAL